MVAACPPSPPSIATTFVRKLYRILDMQYPGIISWNEAGTAFSVFDLDLFELQVMPYHFRGGRDAFHQQIREHNFQPVSIAGAIESYQHANFVRGHPSKLNSIVRVPLPRRRTRRKKTVDVVAADVTVKTEPLDWEAHELAQLMTDLEPPAGNSIKSNDILQWPDVPAVDVPGLSDEDVGAISELVADLSDEQLEMMMQRMFSGSDGVGLESMPPSSPVPLSHSYESSAEFSADLLHALMEQFSTVPT